MTLTQPLTSTATLTLTPSLTLHLDLRATQPGEAPADKWAMLSFQRLEVYQRSIEFLALALEVIAELPTKGHADIADQLRRACAAILDVMRIQQTIKPQRYERGVDLLTSVVAMLTKMI